MSKTPIYRLPLLNPVNGRDYFDYSRAWDFPFVCRMLPLLKNPASAFLIDFTPQTTVSTPEGEPVVKQFFNAYTKRQLFALESQIPRDDFVGLLQSIYSEHFSGTTVIRNPFGLLFHRAKQYLSGVATPA